MSNTKLIIIGAGGHGKVVADIAESMNVYSKISFMDDYYTEKLFYGYQNLGKTEDLYRYKKNTDVFVAIGNNKIREEMIKFLLERKYRVPTLIHKHTTISPSVIIEKGSVIMPGVVINASCKIGIGSIINTNSSIDHDCEIGNFTHLSPGTTSAGNVKIGDNVWIGTNATIINNIRIMSDVIVGAGSVVIKNIKENGTYIGSPTRRLK